MRHDRTLPLLRHRTGRERRLPQVRLPQTLNDRFRTKRQSQNFPRMSVRHPGDFRLMPPQDALNPPHLAALHLPSGRSGAYASRTGLQ